MSLSTTQKAALVVATALSIAATVHGINEYANQPPSWKLSRAEDRGLDAKLRAFPKALRFPVRIRIVPGAGSAATIYAYDLMNRFTQSGWAADVQVIDAYFSPRETGLKVVFKSYEDRTTDRTNYLFALFPHAGWVLDPRMEPGDARLLVGSTP